MTGSGSPVARVGRYELISLLATGGMAELFLARVEWARGVERLVAIKRILQPLAENQTFIDMFLSEAKLAARLNHPNIAQIIDFGDSEGVYFLVMEYVDGPSLRALGTTAHERGAGIPFAHCARIGAFVCEALVHAHGLTDPGTGQRLDLIHRDISPDNVLIARNGAVKVVDFGIARAATQVHRTKTGVVKGKLSYMAPEQLRAGALDLRADVYALGVVLYELVSGKKPYDATSEVNLVQAVLYEDMVPLRERRPDVPPELERIIVCATQREREDRYPDCRAMHVDLEAFLRAQDQTVSSLQLAELVRSLDLPAPRVEEPRPHATPEPWSLARTPSRPQGAAVVIEPAATGTDGPTAHGAEPAAAGGPEDDTVRLRPMSEPDPSRQARSRSGPSTPPQPPPAESEPTAPRTQLEQEELPLAEPALWSRW